MAKLSLAQKIAQLAVVRLVFSGIQVQKAGDGTKIALLELAEPLSTVKSSQRWEDKNSGKSGNYTAYDVTEIKVHEDNFVDGFEFDENGTGGTYEGTDLVLDVTKRGDVWLTSKTFAAMGNEMRQQGRSKRVEDIINAQLKRQGSIPAAQGQPEPVETEG